MSVHRLLSSCTIGTVGLTCKAFLNLGFCKSVTVTGLRHLLNALDDAERNNGRGIITVANHISTLDDPLVWGVLPSRCYFRLRDMRWALGASDIMFTNPLFSAFFRKGQVLETFRGDGVFQPAVDTAIEKLNSGGWVHLFGEGKVNQPYQYEVLRSTEGTGRPSEKDLVARLSRFKWGAGRVLMEARRLPIIIPMWISGFENVMPEPRPKSFPAKFMPRLRQSLSITFAPPLDNHCLVEILGEERTGDDFASLKRNSVDMNRIEEANSSKACDTVEKQRTREALTALLQRAVEQLGYATSGPLLRYLPDAELGPKPFTDRPRD